MIFVGFFLKNVTASCIVDLVEFLAYKVFAEMLQWVIILFTDALKSVDFSLFLYLYCMGQRAKGLLGLDPGFGS